MSSDDLVPKHDVPSNDSNAEIATTEQSSKQDDKKRPIKSFVLRQGRATQGQRDALNEHWPRLGLTVEAGLLNVEQTFERSAPLILEIGFGNGSSLAQMAAANPQQDYVGIEVHRPGIGSLFIFMGKAGVDNVRVYHDDAVKVLNQCIPENSLSGVQLFFPDPWHKQRHNKRRIVQTPFVELLATKIKAGGYFHMATDWQDYAEHMMKVMTASPLFENKYSASNYAPRPEYRPLTKFEQRGQRLGHGVWDLIFTRTD